MLLGRVTGMQRIKYMYTQFLKEPLWFKLIISSSLLASIVFSSSLFSENTTYQSLSKLSAAVFFAAYGLKMRKNLTNSVILFAAAVICLYLSWNPL